MTSGWALALAFATASAPVSCRRPDGTATTRPERPRSTPRDQYLIEGDELKVATATNLYEVVRILRPAWLTRTVRNRQGNEAVVVYLNDRQIGPLNVLREMPSNVARRLQFLSPTEATIRFGPNHGSLAAIVIDLAKN